MASMVSSLVCSWRSSSTSAAAAGSARSSRAARSSGSYPISIRAEIRGSKCSSSPATVSGANSLTSDRRKPPLNSVRASALSRGWSCRQYSSAASVLSSSIICSRRRARPWAVSTDCPLPNSLGNWSTTVRPSPLVAVPSVRLDKSTCRCKLISWLNPPRPFLAIQG